MASNVMIVKLIGEVVSAMVVGDLVFNYEPGRALQIVNSLAQDDASDTYKALKYPLIALFTPITVIEDGNLGYKRVKIAKVVIATESDQNTLVADRFLTGGTFESILYPAKEEFLNQLALHENVVGYDPETFPNAYEEDPGVQPMPVTNDFIDCITILNLEFYINQIKTCS